MQLICCLLLNIPFLRSFTEQDLTTNLIFSGSSKRSIIVLPMSSGNGNTSQIYRLCNHSELVCNYSTPLQNTSALHLFQPNLIPPEISAAVSFLLYCFGFASAANCISPAPSPCHWRHLERLQSRYPEWKRGPVKQYGRILFKTDQYGP